MLDFIRVAAAVPEVSVGNVEENVKRIIEKAEDAEKDKPQLLVFPDQLQKPLHHLVELILQKLMPAPRGLQPRSQPGQLHARRVYPQRRHLTRPPSGSTRR